MRLFSCDACSNPVHFDNSTCVACHAALGFVPETGAMTSLVPNGTHWHAPMLGRDVALCANAVHGACNWLVPVERAGELCPACRHNRTIPDLSIETNVVKFRRIVAAERYLFYSLGRWSLATATKAENASTGLAFDFLADTIAPDGSVVPVLTGHDDGVITLSIAEADDVEREARRTTLREHYRTLLGHFRHEIGHYWWDRLVRDGGRLDDFRALFGDERADYGEALRRHYDEGPPPDWALRHVSAYASSHPWEDFAETWAHLMHRVDTLETARSFGLALAPPMRTASDLALEVDFDPYGTSDFARIAEVWPALAVAVNAIARSLGQRDAYPFVTSPIIEAKMAFAHGLIVDGGSS